MILSFRNSRSNKIHIIKEEYDTCYQPICNQELAKYYWNTKEIEVSQFHLYKPMICKKCFKKYEDIKVKYKMRTEEFLKEIENW